MEIPSMTKSVVGRDNDLGNDLILSHRWKRKYTANQSVVLNSFRDGTPSETLQGGIEIADFKLKSCSPDVVNGNNRIRNDKTDDFDGDYANYLNSMRFDDVVEGEVADRTDFVDVNGTNIDDGKDVVNSNKPNNKIDGFDADYASYLNSMRCDHIAEGEVVRRTDCVDVNGNNIDDGNDVINGNKHNKKTDDFDADYASYLNSMRCDDVVEGEVADRTDCVDVNGNNIDDGNDVINGNKHNKKTDDFDADYASYLNSMRCDDVVEGEVADRTDCVDVNGTNIDEDNDVINGNKHNNKIGDFDGDYASYLNSMRCDDVVEGEVASHTDCLDVKGTNIDDDNDGVNSNKHVNKTDGFDSDYASYLNTMRCDDVPKGEVAGRTDCVDVNGTNIDDGTDVVNSNEHNNKTNGFDGDYASYLNSMRCEDVAEEEVTDRTGYVDINSKNIDDDNNNESTVDPQYKMFLANIKENGNSYVLQVPLNNDIPFLLKYEQDSSSYPHRETNLATFRSAETKTLRNMLGAENITRHKRKKTDSQTRESDVLGKPRTLRNMLGVENVTNQKRKSPTIEKNDEVDHADRVPNRTNENMSKRPNLKHHFNRGVNNVIKVEAGYQLFLSCLKQDDDNQKVDENNECLLIEKAVKHHGSIPSTFKVMLMNVLRKPHDDKECDDLYKEVSRKRPRERHRESRRGVIKRCILPNCPGRSYLDIHPDLAMEVEKARTDRHKVLNLLRGFFFWLQYCVMDGSFFPWCNEECSRMMPS